MKMNKERRLHPALMVALAAVGFALATMLCHWLLRHEAIYNVFGRAVPTYVKVTHEDGSWEAQRVRAPFTQPTNENMLAWDAGHYDEIRQYLYDTNKMWEGNFAFYPLFPLAWRASRLGAMGVAALNYLLYAMGMALVALALGRGLARWQYLLMLCAPYVVIFMIPYSEALFFLGIAMGMLGLSKRMYWLYFLGFFIGCATRAAGNILVVAWVIVDVLMALRNRESAATALANMLRHIAPVVAAVLCVALLQRLRGAEHWLEYVMAQRLWGKELSWPQWPFTDWSAEGRSVTQPLVYILTLPALAWLGAQAWHAVRPPTHERAQERYALRLLSVLFFVGNVMLALFTQRGCLFSLARLLTCTPFFVFLIADLCAASKPKGWMYGMLCAMVAAICLVPNKGMVGGWLVLLLCTLVFMGDRLAPRPRGIVLGATLGLNVCWTAYLFNCFLTGGWIFT